jgi:hypothetical protein
LAGVELVPPVPLEEDILGVVCDVFGMLCCFYTYCDGSFPNIFDVPLMMVL